MAMAIHFKQRSNCRCYACACLLKSLGVADSVLTKNRNLFFAFVAASIALFLIGQITLLRKVTARSATQHASQGVRASPALIQVEHVSLLEFVNSTFLSNWTTTPPKTTKEELLLNRQPYGYPWSAATSQQTQQQYNFSLLWERVNKPQKVVRSSNRLPMVLPLYLVHQGKLYLWKKHKALLNNFRVPHYQQHIITSLNLARRSTMHGQQSTIDPQIKELATEPLPFFIDFGDFRKCWGATYPLFSYATFGPTTSTNKTVVDGEAQECIPLGIPCYDTPPVRPATSNAASAATYTSELETWDSVFEKQNQDYPWDTKINKAIWRGSTTGAGYAYSNWGDLPRVQLVQYSLMSDTKRINAGFNRIVQRNAVDQEEIENNGLLKDSIPMRNFQKYKAIIDMDGNSWSSRFGALLCMNSVVLKVQPSWVDYYFHSELQPFVHYLPIHKNLSNLEEMMNMVVNDNSTTKMLTIVQNANSWCKNKFTAPQLKIDMAWIMISYLEMLKHENAYSGNFTKWKDHFDNNTMKRNWILVRDRAEVKAGSGINGGSLTRARANMPVHHLRQKNRHWLMSKWWQKWFMSKWW